MQGKERRAWHHFENEAKFTGCGSEQAMSRAIAGGSYSLLIVRYFLSLLKVLKLEKDEERKGLD